MADDPNDQDLAADPTDADDQSADAAASEEWEKMLADEDAQSDLSSGRVLNQDEIDSLLGLDLSQEEGAESAGIMALINSAMVNYERLPMLEVVFDRLVRMMSTSLRNFTSDNVEVSLDQITSIRFGDYLNSIPLPAMLSVFKAEEWDNYGLLVVDSALIYSIVDVLLGGRRGTAAMRIEGRPYTTIERSLVERMVHVVLADLSAAFDPLSPVTFRFERLETNPRFATIVRPGNAAVLAKLRIDMEDRGGRLELLIPYATLEPVRELLLQMFMGEKFGRDSIWENHLAAELWQTDLSLNALLDEVSMPLRDVLNWQVGSQLLLNTPPDGLVNLRCGDVDMFAGRMGRMKGNIAVRIDKQMLRKDEERQP
ncbi:MAG: flagellar motor switch protein FliM [Rhodospirillaceae bacterium]|nr:flagellar motor switch protein FliM [Rhodospirillaceae bacterium]MCA8931939.1 flagellar motor switch protein FliM [Rhodospirillaceae bacterium]